MTRTEYKIQFENILNQLDTLDFKSNYYRGDEQRPFLTDKGIKFIICELKTIVVNLKHLNKFQGDKKTKKYLLFQFEAFYLLIEKTLSDNLYYQLKNILNL